MKDNLAIGLALAGAAALGALAVAYSNAQPERKLGPPTQQTEAAAPTLSVKATAPAAPTTSTFNAQQEGAIREIVRQYLLQHPEVLADAAAFDKKQSAISAAAARDGVKKNLAELLSDEDGARAGKNIAKAKVAVIELFDYHCGYCKHAAPIVKQLTQSDESVKIVFRELPILRKESEYAAEAALAARAQGKYTELHFAMMDASGVLSRERILDIAKKTGLDAAKLDADTKSPKIRKAIDETRRIAR
ncbi:MAG: DsbA family protein, partial [Parvularculaceae bacterium]|nr:DsbA family protein [Parvularculaceae bacterium]